MANDRILLEVIVTNKGLKLQQKGIEDLTSSTQRANKASGDLYNTQAKGVIGTANSSKSFSKLAQTIGSEGGGLVGAYATLAANAFAVSAAFNALRQAAQVEQMMKGLEVQGARTGKSLVAVSTEVQKLTGYSISAADAMKATALMSSAGFSTKGMEDLTKVATNAALALGRNVPDALDRISKGVTKLEPELLDELGIMTKLSEAQNRYALENNKSVASLSSFEKRQAMLNAVVAEGTAKFGGLSDEVEVNPYDQLAATFQNLTNNVLNFINVLGGPIASIFSNQGILLGGVILFISTIRQQLLPALYLMGKVARERREYFLDMAAGARDAAKSTLELANAQQKAAVTAKTEKFIAPISKDSVRTRATPKGFDYEAAAVNAIDQNSAYAKDIAKLDSSISARMKNIRRERGELTDAEIAAGVTAKGWSKDYIAQKEAEVESIQKVKASLEDLYKTQRDGEASVVAAKAKSKVENTKFRANEKAAAAENLRAQSIELAGEGKVKEALEKRKESLEEFGKKLRYERIANQREGTSQLPPIFDKLKLGIAGIGSGVQIGAAAFMKFIPYIGVAATAAGALYAGWEKWGKSDAAKAQSEALIKYKEAVDTATKSVEELKRINDSNVSAGLKAAQTLTIQANATRGIADAMQEVLAAQEKVSKEGVVTTSYLEAIFNKQKAISKQTGVSIDDPMFAAIEKSYGDTGSGGVDIMIQSMLPEELNGIDEQARETAVSVANLTKIIDKNLVDSFKLAAANGGTLEEGAKRLAESPALQREFILQAAAAYDGLAEVVKELSDAFKQAGEASTEFITSAIPKTPFDNLLKSTRTILDGVAKLNRSIGATDADKLALLTQIPPEYAAFLDVKSQKLIQEVQLQGDIYNSIKAQADAGKELTSSQQTQLTSAKAFLESKKSEVSIITDSIQAFEETLALNQAIEITNKSRIASIQAIMSANQEAYSSGAAGEKARIEREEQIRSLQVAQLQTQKAMIDASIAQAEAAIKIADAELLRLDITKDISREQVAQISRYATLDLTTAKTAAKSAGFTESYLAQVDAMLSEGKGLSLEGMTASQSEAAKSYVIAYKTFETATKINEAYEKSAATNRTIATLKLESAALSEEINNINQANLSAEQKSARINAASVRVKNEIAAIEDKNASITRNNAETQQEINDLINNTAYQARYEATRREAKAVNSIADIEALRTRTLKDLEASRTTAQADYNAAVAKGLTQEADGYRELITNITNKIRLENESVRLATEEIKLTTSKANLEEILFDTRTRGLEIQIEALEVMRKQADLQSTLLSKEQELRKIRRETEASRRGTEISPTAQKSEEYRSAVETYKLAVQQLTLKKLEIELEYGLLEAKRLLMEQQLLADQKRIDSEAAILRAKGNTEGASSLETMSAQLGKAYENIHRFNYEALKQNALKIAEMDVEILRQRAMKAYYDMVNSILPQNQANKMIQGVQDAVEIFNSLGKSDMSIEEQLAPALSPAVKAQQDNTAMLAKNNQALAEVVQTNLGGSVAQAIETILAKFSNSLREAIKNKVESSTAAEVGEQAGDSIAQIIKTSLSSLIPAGPLSSGYGRRERPKKGASRDHLGLDIGLGQGTPIYAPEAGLVELSKTVRGYGKRIELNLGMLEGTSDKLSTTYSHLSRLAVQAGEKVEKGQLIGYSGGKPGTAGAGTSTGAHLHFETLINGEKVNPNNPTILKIATEDTSGILVTGSKDTKEAKRDIRLQREEEINAAIMSARANIDTNATAIEDRMLKMALGIRVGIQASIDALRELGPQGVAVAAMVEGFSNISIIAAKTMGTMKQTYEDFNAEEVAAAKKRAEEEGQVFDKTTADLTSKAEFRAQKMADSFAAASAVIGMVASMLSASSDAKIASIDREIAAEQKRDGKSAGSVAKLEAMEKKKDSLARKAFNTNKKLMMAQAVMSTAAAIASTLATAPDPVSKIILAGIIGAMGAAQIAVIAGTQYESTGGAKAASMPSTLSIGKRGDTVDLARGPSANAGGEAGFIRGSQGTGSNASNFRTIGSAYGGELMRGYGNRGFVVGEKGPEIITPETPINVTPANDVMPQQPLNATFNIQALDASGVEELLVAQKGNIISMLRSAANASGQGFMEDVNTNIYTRPSVNKL